MTDTEAEAHELAKAAEVTKENDEHGVRKLETEESRTMVQERAEQVLFVIFQSLMIPLHTCSFISSLTGSYPKIIHFHFHFMWSSTVQTTLNS